MNNVKLSKNSALFYVAKNEAEPFYLYVDQEENNHIFLKRLTKDEETKYNVELTKVINSPELLILIDSEQIDSINTILLSYIDDGLNF